MLSRRLAKRVWLFFFLAVIAVYLYGLGRMPFVGPDEPRYAEVAREMFVRTDLVTPTLGGRPWFEKPSLLYWMMMASFGAFGVSEWAARLGPALSGLLSVLVVYLIARRVEKSAEGDEANGLALACGVMFSTCIGSITFSRGASFDIIVTMTVTCALAFFFCSETETDAKRRLWWQCGFYVFVGASLLAKGLVGVVIPFGVVFVYFVLRREMPSREKFKGAVWGIALAMAVAAIWYGPVIARHGWTFIDEFFIKHHFARYVSNKYHHPQPFYFYIPVMAILALPWTPFLISALIATRRWTWRAPTLTSKFRILSLAWLVVPIVFFSLSGSKLPGYVLPALPGAMLLAGERMAFYLRGAGESKSMRATGACLLLLCAVGSVYGLRDGDVSRAATLLVTLPLAIAGMIALVFSNTERRVGVLLIVVGAMFVSVVLAINCAVAPLARRESLRDLFQQAAARRYASAPVYGLHTVEHTSEFYASGRVNYGADGELVKFESVFQVRDAARGSGPVLVIIPLEYVEQLTASAMLDTEVIGNNGALVVVAVRARE